MAPGCRRVGAVPQHHSLQKRDVRAMSALLLIATEERTSRDVSNVPDSEVATHAELTSKSGRLGEETRARSQDKTGSRCCGDFCEPPRLLLITAAEINPIDNVAVRPDHMARHSSIERSIADPPDNLLPNVETALKGCLLEMRMT
jgi:hypothetical protein